MIGSLIEFALFFLNLFFLLPLLIYSIYLHVIPEHFHDRSASHKGDKETPISH